MIEYPNIDLKQNLIELLSSLKTTETAISKDLSHLCEVLKNPDIHIPANQQELEKIYLFLVLYVFGKHLNLLLGHDQKLVTHNKHALEHFGNQHKELDLNTSNRPYSNN